jgi:hypothetical protein
MALRAFCARGCECERAAVRGGEECMGIGKISATY